MAAEGKSTAVSTKSAKNKKRKHYLPYSKAVKKGSYPLHPGVQGFFITCDGGKERQASHEAINVIDTFFEELIQGNGSGGNLAGQPRKPLNTKITFASSDSSSSDDDNDESLEKEEEVPKEENQSDPSKNGDSNNDNLSNQIVNQPIGSCEAHEVQDEDGTDDAKVHEKHEEPCVNEAEEPPAKKQCCETNTYKSENVSHERVEEKSIDQLIDAEIKELGNKSKRRFISRDSGCNGVAFVQMRKKDGDPSPTDIVQHIMTSAASSRKHMSRFILRVLPVEVSCYASEEDISRAIKPIIAEYFPIDTQNPLKFAVLYDARANTGVERMKLINAVAKCVPEPHKVDLNNPDKTIVVQIVKTVCLIGVVAKYKELAKYNLRQLTSPKQ